MPNKLVIVLVLAALLTGYALGYFPKGIYFQIVGTVATQIWQCPTPQVGTVVFCPIHFSGYPPVLLLSVDGTPYKPIETKSPGQD